MRGEDLAHLRQFVPAAPEAADEEAGLPSPKERDYKPHASPANKPASMPPTYTTGSPALIEN